MRAFFFVLSLFSVFSCGIVSPIGGQCQTSVDCAGAKGRCLNKGFVLGYCTMDCDSSSDCGSDVCLESGSGGVCTARCEKPGSTSTCRTGYTCKPLSNANYGYCAPAF